MGVVSECCCKEVYIIIDILIIIITFPYSTCISSFLTVSSLFICSFLNFFFDLVKHIILNLYCIIMTYCHIIRKNK